MTPAEYVTIKIPSKGRVTHSVRNATENDYLTLCGIAVWASDAVVLDGWPRGQCRRCHK